MDREDVELPDADLEDVYNTLEATRAQLMLMREDIGRIPTELIALKKRMETELGFISIILLVFLSLILWRIW